MDTLDNIQRIVEICGALANSPRRSFLVASDANRVALEDAVDYVVEHDDLVPERLLEMATLAAHGGVLLPETHTDADLGTYSERLPAGVRVYLSAIAGVASGDTEQVFEYRTSVEFEEDSARLNVDAAYHEGARRALSELCGEEIYIDGWSLTGTTASFVLDPLTCSRALCEGIGELVFVCGALDGLSYLAEHPATEEWEHELINNFLVEALEDVRVEIAECLSVERTSTLAAWVQEAYKWVACWNVSCDEYVSISYSYDDAINELSGMLADSGETPDNVLEAARVARIVLERWFD